MARRKFVYLCTNALLLQKRLGLFRPSPYFVWSVHLDGDREMHDRSVCEEGVYERAVAAIRAAKAAGFRVNINCTLFNDADPGAASPDFSTRSPALGVDGITVSPGYAYERAPDQAHFLTRERTKQLFRDIFRRGRGARAWSFSQSSLFLDFLAGNQEYRCTPWGNPTRNVFGWQRPCYLLGEGYAPTFRALMEETDWDAYGTGNYEKCANCMVHSGYEASAVQDAVRHPLKALAVGLRGVRTEGAMAPEIPLQYQRPAQYVFSRHVEQKLAAIRVSQARGQGVDGRVRARALRCGRRARCAAAKAAARAYAPASPARRRRGSFHPARGNQGRWREHPPGAVGDDPEGANGNPCAAANAAAICDSVSTAAAPVARRKRAFGRRVAATGASTAGEIRGPRSGKSRGKNAQPRHSRTASASRRDDARAR